MKQFLQCVVLDETQNNFFSILGPKKKKQQKANFVQPKLTLDGLESFSHVWILFVFHENVKNKQEIFFIVNELGQLFSFSLSLSLHLYFCLPLQLHIERRTHSFTCPHETHTPARDKKPGCK